MLVSQSATQLKASQLSTTPPMEEEDHHQHKYVECQTPHFFQIILHKTLQNKKLVVPKSFVRKHGGGLCLNRVYLKVPSGDVWEVELNREDDSGEMWLLNGWQDFVESYNIKFGYFLVFCYQGNSEFEVLIFDETTSEIKYPCKFNTNKQHSADDVGPCLVPVKPEIEENRAELLIDHNASKINEREKNTKRTGKGSRVYDNVNGELGTSKSFSPSESRDKAEAIIRSTAFDSPNPYFRIIMRSTYVNKNYALWLPGRFIMNHIGQKECYLKFSIPCGRFWTVKCRFRMRGNQPEARVQSGWKPFVMDNNLAVDDVCVFELIDSVKLHFQVTIFRAVKDPSFSHCPEPKECTGRRISLKRSHHEESSSDIKCAATRNHTSKNPSFKIVMTKARMRRKSVPIQTGFSKHLKQRAQVVTLEAAGRLWHVKVCFYRRRLGRESIFSSGWSNFVRDNSLQVGDVCIFEFVEMEEMVLKVSIHKAST